MEIRIGNYILRSDAYSMWIDEEFVNSKGKDDVRKIAGYSQSFPTLLASFQRNKTLDNNAKTIEGLLRHLAKVSTDMSMLNEAAVKEDLRIIRKERKKNA